MLRIFRVVQVMAVSYLCQLNPQSMLTPNPYSMGVRMRSMVGFVQEFENVLAVLTVNVLTVSS